MNQKHKNALNHNHFGHGEDTTPCLRRKSTESFFLWQDMNSPHTLIYINVWGSSKPNSVSAID